MNRLVALVGPSGAGKTSLLQALSATGGFSTGVEDHVGRPFQELFNRDKRFGLANQVDYLLYRAEQERELRASKLPGLTDGGLDMDFNGFTRLFHAHGWLSNPEFELCRRLYDFLRSELPLPDLVVVLEVSQAVIEARLVRRQRINLVSQDDAQQLTSFMEEWIATLPADHVLRVDVSDERLDYAHTAGLVERHLRAER